MSNSITVSALLAQGRAVQAHAANIANLNSKNPDGTNYIPVDSVTLSAESGGVISVLTENPNASLEDELIGLLDAKTSYTAAAKLIGVQRDMDDALLDIFS
jgi:flagellar basal body rod protein FlgC